MLFPDLIVNAAYQLLGANYPVWEGCPIPMWKEQGYGTTYNTLPPVSYFMPDGDNWGVECSDLINYALIYNGLDPIGGTEDAYYNLQYPEGVDWHFNPNTPGQRAAVALSPYVDAAPGQQDHIALYWDEHYLIQSLNGSPPYYGVPYDYTDTQIYSWGGDTAFIYYAFLPGVQYPGIDV
jgi:hypothetical protein